MQIKSFLSKLRRFVDGQADTPFEYFMLFVVIVNIITLGLETSPDLLEKYDEVFFWIDQICLWIFIFELIVKAFAFNKNFFGEHRVDENNERFFHANKWNIFDLIIVIVSIFASLPFFSVFRVFRLFKSMKIVKGIKSLRVVKTLKLVNNLTKLRIIVKALIKAIPSVLWTFFLLVVFAYVYAIIGTNIFGADFPECFGTLGISLMTLFQLTSLDSGEVINVFPWAWIYFITYNFIEASIIMNVIVGVICDSVKDSRLEVEEEDNQENKEVTLQTLSLQIAHLEKELLNLKQ